MVTKISAQIGRRAVHKVVHAGQLAVAYEESGDEGGWPVVLSHGFPYDVRAFDDVVPILTEQGARVIVPYLRGYGPTRFLDEGGLRSGEQAAIGMDLLGLLDALNIERAGLAGYDWGSRASCVLAALHPQRVDFLVAANGYAIQDIASAGTPAAPESELRYWYQYYFHSARGAAGLEQHRRDFCRLLWNLWSPTWSFDAQTYERTASSFDNPNFVEVVIHSYRHRFGLVAGDPAFATVEAQLATQPPITVPTITIDGDADGVVPPTDGSAYARLFTAGWEHRRVANAGHNLPQEAPTHFADAILSLHGG
jgi:pimeloyl-ACP methyl ester carboxylesterase